MINYTEITNSKEDKKLLKHFYEELYLPEFPDPDERESLENIEQYLELKSQGWYGKNNYHIIIATEDDEPVAGAIADFLAEANSGIIEFLVVSPKFRQMGIGKAMLGATETLLINDAEQRLGCALDCIVCEMNDPFKPTEIQDNLDAVKRTLIWDKCGYYGLDFPYFQPALSKEQESVFNLILITKIFQKNWSKGIPSQKIKLIIHEYFRWAMRIETPENCIEYHNMNIFLNTIKKVNLLSLNIYVGHDLLKPIIIHEIDNPIDPDFATAMSVYQKAFPPGLMTIETREFVQALNPVQQSNYTYHLWAIRATESSEVEGMASFFSFPKVGFGGYVAFEGSLKGTWRIKLLIARMEQQMLRDRHPNDADGWYVETNLPNNKSIFSRLGFYEVNINYEQPFLESSQSGLQMRLFYKPYGRVYEVPKVRCTEFLDSISQIFKVVYGISTPQENSSYKKLEAQIPLFADDLISFY